MPARFIFTIVIGFAFVLISLLVLDRRANGQEIAEDQIIEEQAPSSSRPLYVLAPETLESVREEKAVVGDLASKYAALYDSCRFR